MRRWIVPARSQEPRSRLDGRCVGTPRRGNSAVRQFCRREAVVGKAPRWAVASTHNPQARRLQRAIPGTNIARTAIRVPDLASSLRERPGLGWGTSTRGFSAARRQVTDPVTAPTSACRHLRCGRACAQTRDRQPSAHDGARNMPRKHREHSEQALSPHIDASARGQRRRLWIVGFGGGVRHLPFIPSARNEDPPTLHP